MTRLLAAARTMAGVWCRYRSSHIDSYRTAIKRGFWHKSPFLGHISLIHHLMRDRLAQIVYVTIERGGNSL